MFIYLSTHSTTRFFTAHIFAFCAEKSSQQQNKTVNVIQCVFLFTSSVIPMFCCCCCWWWFRLHFTCYGNRLKRRMSIIVNGFECATRQFFIHSSPFPFPFFVCARASDSFRMTIEIEVVFVCVRCTLPLPPLLLLLFCRCRLLVLLLLFCVLKFLPLLFFAVIETTIYYLWYF